MQVMRGITFRSLMLAWSFFLALPPGWCCTLMVGDCCAATKERAETTEPDSESDCCCRGEHETPRTPAPRENSPNQSPCDGSTGPCKSPCCERLPTLKPVVEIHTVDVAVLPFELVDHHMSMIGQWPVVDVPDAIPICPPLNLLHCQWLC